jgi:hypothetical protein
VAAKGFDNFAAGVQQAYYGVPIETVTKRLATAATGSEVFGNALDIGTDLISPGGLVKQGASRGVQIVDMGNGTIGAVRSGTVVPALAKAGAQGGLLAGGAKGAEVLMSQAANGCPDGASKGPNPGGKLGGPEHRGKVAQRANELVKEGHEIKAGGGRLPERGVRTPEGKLRFPDIETKGPQGRPYFENVGKAKMNGDPIARENRALKDIERATGRRPGFTPYP